jgi:hypothetical protein
MKSTDFKKLIKEAVREVIQEELKEILLEAVRTPKTVVRESISPNAIPSQPINPTFTPPVMDTKKAYMDVMNETALSFTSRDAQVPFRPQVSDPVNGSLGAGEVGMDQIMNLLNSK